MKTSEPEGMLQVTETEIDTRAALYVCGPYRYIVVNVL